MKLLACLLLSVFVSQAFSDSCGPTATYQQKTTLPDGSTLFRYPGIYAPDLQYNLTCPQARCLQVDLDEICRVHLKMFKGLSFRLESCAGASHCAFAYFDLGKYSFQKNYMEILSEIVCK